jgi:hypothetical protein
MTLVERGLQIPLQEEGQFAINGLRAGEYTLEIASNGDRLKQAKITVPSPDFDVTV